MRHELGKVWLSKVWLLVVLPAAFLFKDLIATVALLATEPGITAKAALYYSAALLPGVLFADGAEMAALYNFLFGAVIGGVLYLWGVRRALTRGRLR